MGSHLCAIAMLRQDAWTAAVSRHVPHPLCSRVLMLKPNVGEMVLTSSPLNFLRIVVFPALSSPLHESCWGWKLLLFIYVQRWQCVCLAVLLAHWLAISRHTAVNSRDTQNIRGVGLRCNRFLDFFCNCNHIRILPRKSRHVAKLAELKGYRIRSLISFSFCFSFLKIFLKPIATASLKLCRENLMTLIFFFFLLVLCTKFQQTSSHREPGSVWPTSPAH